MWVKHLHPLLFSNLFRKPNSQQKKLKSYLQEHWGVVPKELEWYEKALRHKSVVGSGKFCHNDCNERLELLGDAVLDTVVTEYLFMRFPDANEGLLTKIRARIVNRQMLGDVGKKAGLNNLIEARIGTEDSMDKITGNALEAWLGAIYLDRGFETTKKSICDKMLKDYLDIDDVVKQSSDFKSQLIEWAQQQKISFDFRTYASEGSVSSNFVCEIHINGEMHSIAEDRSKKLAEKQAAKLSCQKLGIE
ncbi:MAG: ribonuclease III [Flavobacteriales bacterium]